MSIADTVVCTGTLDIVNTYIEDCTFGDELSYRFEFRHIDSDIWTPLASGTETVDCKSVTESNRTLQVPWTIQSVNSSHEGYYRMIVSSPTHIGNVNCRAMSDSVYVKVAGAGKPADIRVDICPSPSRAIRLSSFLDTVAYNTLSWTKIQTGAPDINSATGEINTAGITGLSKYKYSMTSKCGTGTAIAYVYPLKNRLLRHVDTIAICKDEERSRNIHINSILGLDVNGGTWVYDNSVNPDNTVESNVKTYPSTSSYYGALIFDAYQAWHDATDTDYSIDYRGDTGAKKFVFRYTATDSCFGNVDKEIVIVVTETM
jgi:hypothetical protein